MQDFISGIAKKLYEIIVLASDRRPTGKLRPLGAKNMTEIHANAVSVIPAHRQ